MLKEQQLVGFLGVVMHNFKKDEYPITDLNFLNKDCSFKNGEVFSEPPDLHLLF